MDEKLCEFVRRVDINPEHIRELHRIQNITIFLQPYRFRLYDVLFIKKEDLTKFAENEILGKFLQKYDNNFDKIFPHFGFILNRVYKKLCERDIWLFSAKITLWKIVGDYVPTRVVNQVLSNLENADLKAICGINWTEDLQVQMIV